MFEISDIAKQLLGRADQAERLDRAWAARGLKTENDFYWFAVSEAFDERGQLRGRLTFPGVCGKLGISEQWLRSGAGAMETVDQNEWLCQQKAKDIARFNLRPSLSPVDPWPRFNSDDVQDDNRLFSLLQATVKIWEASPARWRDQPVVDVAKIICHVDHDHEAGVLEGSTFLESCRDLRGHARAYITKVLATKEPLVSPSDANYKAAINFGLVALRAMAGGLPHSLPEPLLPDWCIRLQAKGTTSSPSPT